MDVLGPLDIVHAPVPTRGLFAANSAVPVTHIVWLLPAAEVVGTASTVIITDDALGVHTPLDIVHVKVYTPGPPAGVKTALYAEVLLNCVDKRLGPLVTVHAPVPTPGLFAANAADTAVIHML